MGRTGVLRNLVCFESDYPDFFAALWTKGVTKIDWSGGSGPVRLPARCHVAIPGARRLLPIYS